MSKAPTLQVLKDITSEIMDGKSSTKLEDITSVAKGFMYAGVFKASQYASLEGMTSAKAAQEYIHSL